MTVKVVFENELVRQSRTVLSTMHSSGTIVAFVFTLVPKTFPLAEYDRTETLITHNVTFLAVRMFYVNFHSMFNSN